MILVVDSPCWVWSWKLACACVISEATILLVHTRASTMLRPWRAFPMSCFADVFPGQEPPPLHSFFSLPVMSVFCFPFVFDSHCYHGFYEATIMTSTITFEIGCRRRRGRRETGLGLVKSSVGFFDPGLTTHMALMEGVCFFPYVNVTRRSWFFECFPEISRVTIRVGARRKVKEKDLVCAVAVDGSSRIMIPGR